MSNTISSIYDLDYPQKEYAPRADTEQLMGIMFLTFFFAFLLYKVIMFQFITNEKTEQSIRNLEEHMEVAEKHLVDHGIRLEDLHQNLTDADISSLRDKVQQLREDLNLMALSYKHTDHKGHRTNSSIPDIQTLSSYILEREEILGSSGTGQRYKEYLELAQEVTR
jgi:hypothetical protein